MDNLGSPENTRTKGKTARKILHLPENDRQRRSTKIPVMKRGTHVERERRQIMAEHYKQLHSIVPGLSSKATKTTIVDETIAYIHHLEEVVKGLETKTMSKAFPSSSSEHDIVVTYFGGIVFVGIHGASRPDLAGRIFEAFEKNMVEVLTAGISCSGDRESMFTITARLDGMGGDAPEIVIGKLERDLAVCLSKGL